MSRRSSDDQATRHDGRDHTRHGRLAQQLTEHYRAQAEACPPDGSSFSQQWRAAQARAEAPTTAHGVWRGLTPVWGVGLSVMATALSFTLLSPDQQPPQRVGLGATQTTLVDEELTQDAFAWGDGWLEGEEWSLEWSPPEGHDPALTPLSPSGGREG